MPNMRKQLVVLTAVAGFLSVSALDSFAQSISPFGKGNPIQSLSEQLDRLEGRVGTLENSPVPTSISGFYESTLIGNCREVTEVLDATQNAPAITDFYTNMVLETLHFLPGGIIERSEKYWLLSVSPTVTMRKRGTAQVCAYRYEMTDPFDGTFIWKSNEGITTDCAKITDGTGNPWRGEVSLKGRIFDGGKTLTLRSEKFDEEVRSDINSRTWRFCTRTNTLRKIKD